MKNEVVKKLEVLNESLIEVKQMNEIFGGQMAPVDASIDTVTCTPSGNHTDPGDPDA